MKKILTGVIGLLLILGSCCYAEDSQEFVDKGWEMLGKNNLVEAYKVTDQCIAQYSSEALQKAGLLKGYPDEKDASFAVMNNVAVCSFIKAEALMRDGKTEEAQDILKLIIEKYPYTKGWDPRGWYWSVKEKAEITLNKLIKGIIEEEIKAETKVTKITLNDQGTEFPVNYAKYGTFSNVGKKGYKYELNDPVELSKAVGEGIYPNTCSVRYDPRFMQFKKDLYKVNHWEILNTRDLELAFYKWCYTAEPPGVQLFYIGDLFERSGLYKQAVKAYYAILVHFPTTYGWTYWRTPWYVGEAVLWRVNYLLREHPELGVTLIDADLKVINGFDNNIANDIFIVNPGRLVKTSLLSRICTKRECRKLGKAIETRGGSKSKLVKYESGDWELFVDGKPFVVQGVTYAPTRIGESPDTGSLQNWTTQDLDKDGRIEGPYQAWVDKNKNNKRDPGEKEVGDFKLMQDMGVNCIRQYHHPTKPDKKLLGQMYEKYGIMVAIGDFLGKYAIGSGASWKDGTDYSNPDHQEKMLDSIRQMVLEYKDEPYVVLWILGNENVYGVACNADKDPESFFKFANKAAQLIKELDPTRVVAIASGDTLFLDYFGKNCLDIDIFGTNAYRGKYGFNSIWRNVKAVCGKPAMITEFGAPAFAMGFSLKEADEFQAEYHRGCWLNVEENITGYGEGNAIGGFIFEWLDEWWKAYEPAYHDKKGLFSGPFLDGYMHEEWLGICGQGDGKNSPHLRELRKAYFMYKKLWSNTTKRIGR